MVNYNNIKYQQLFIIISKMLILIIIVFNLQFDDSVKVNYVESIRQMAVIESVCRLLFWLESRVFVGAPQERIIARRRDAVADPGGHREPWPPKRWTKHFSHLVYQSLIDYMMNETHQNCLNRYFNS